MRRAGHTDDRAAAHQGSGDLAVRAHRSNASKAIGLSRAPKPRTTRCARVQGKLRAWCMVRKEGFEPDHGFARRGPHELLRRALLPVPPLPDSLESLRY